MKYTKYTIEIIFPTGKGDIIFDIGSLRIPYGVTSDYIQDYGAAFLEGIFNSNFLKTVDEKGKVKIKKVDE